MSNEDNDVNNINVQNPTNNVVDEPTPRRSSRRTAPPIWHMDYAMEGSNMHYSISKYFDYSGISKSYQCFLSNISKVLESQTYNEVVTNKNWIYAMKEEIKALEENNTSTLGPIMVR